MASISSLTGSSSSSSIYGTRNVISGLASGIDTEALIQNAVSGYETKISSLTQKRTKMEWQQEALRSIITKMASFSDKFTSYTSSTNLMSASFFNNAVKVSTLGANKDKVSASGKTSSDVQLLGVKQLATSASYTVSGGVLGSGNGENPTVAGGALDLSKTYEKSLTTGTLALGYGGSNRVTISLGEDDLCKNGEELAAKINEKLAEQDITISGNTSKASEKIKASWDGTNIQFEDISGAGNGAYVLSATGDLKTRLGIQSNSVSDKVSSIAVGDTALYDANATYAEMLKEKEISFTLDGKTKKISLADTELQSSSTIGDVQNVLKEKLDAAFGKDKVTVALNSASDGLSFSVAKGSTLKIDGGKALGLASDSETSYANTSKKLGELLSGFDWDSTDTAIKAGDNVSLTKVEAKDGAEEYWTDKQGNRYTEIDGEYYRTDKDGNLLHALEISGKQVGAFSKETALETVMTTINGNADANVSLSYSKTTNLFKFTADESGEAGNIEIKGGLAGALFGNTEDAGDNYVKGQDAVFTVSVNGEPMKLTRSDNSVDIDGLTINMKGTFGYEADNRVKVADGVYEAATSGEGYNFNINGLKYVNDNGEYVDINGTTYAELIAEKGWSMDQFQNLKTTGDFMYRDADGVKITDPAQQTAGKLIQGTEAVTFESSADADTIVDAIKTMVEEYNAMAKEIKDAYSTMPLENSNGKAYEPLTDADMEGMSESAIKSYEEKAKTGLLFADRDLSNLYTRLTNAVQSVGADLESIGISVAYDNGLTTLSLNESKLRSTLETDPDKVRDTFTKSKSSGASTDGLMQALKTPLDMYAKTTGGTKGILIEKAGSVLSPTSLYQNTIQKQLDALDKQITSWQDKLSDKVDYYTSKFTQLEVLINEMNSQSSALAGLTGGY